MITGALGLDGFAVSVPRTAAASALEKGPLMSRRRSKSGTVLRAASLLAGATLAVSCGKGDTTTTPAKLPPAPPACEVQAPALDAPAPGPFTVVRVDASLSAPQKLAVQACVGLRNRATPGSVYVDATPYDGTWLKELGMVPAATIGAKEFLASCVGEIGACVRYDYAAQRPLLPNVLTAAAALGAVPLDRALDLPCESPAFDAIAELADKATPELATRYVFEKFGDKTTGLAMLNPGYDTNPPKVSAPAITQDMRPSLVDFVFSQRLFVTFLVNGCVDGHPEKPVLSSIVNAGRWPTPVAVYGYNNSWNVLGGYLYEAQTRCLDSRNMGAIASEADNLSFFSTRAAPITGSGAVVPNEAESIAYDPTKTYVAFVVGDGDNVQYMLSTRRDWFQQRVADCEANPATCLPLTWSVSSHLTRLAPDVLRWYYAQSRRTKRDHFVLPPSGHLYAYPTSLAEREQDAFVKATERDACILGVDGVVHWDFLGTWPDAEQRFLPKYAKGGAIRGVFPINVPYVFPTFPWWPDDQFFEVLSADGRDVALFKSRSWRGVSDDRSEFTLSPKAMADELGGYPKGTVSWVYMTSDGGLTLENSFLALSKILPSHVRLVSASAAARLALASKGK